MWQCSITRFRVIGEGGEEIATPGRSPKRTTRGPSLGDGGEEIATLAPSPNSSTTRNQGDGGEGIATGI